MRTSRRTAAIVAAWATVGVVGAAALTGVAMAADPAPAPSSTSTSATSTDAAAGADGARAKAGELRRLGKRVLHGEFTVQGKDGVKIVDTQLGVITAVSSSSLDVKSSDGYTQTWTLSAESRVRADKKPGTAADLTVGETVRLLGPKSGGAATVRIAVVVPAATTG
jgi:hypothetical protein